MKRRCSGKDRQLMDGSQRPRGTSRSGSTNEGLIKGEDVHLKTLEEAIRKLDKRRGDGTQDTPGHPRGGRLAAATPSERHPDPELRSDARQADEVPVLVRGLALAVVDVADPEERLHGPENRGVGVDEPSVRLDLRLREEHGAALLAQRVHVVDPVGQQQPLARKVVGELAARLEAQRWNWQLLSDEILGGLVAGGSGREARVPDVEVEKGVREARLGAKIGVRICQQE